MEPILLHSTGICLLALSIGFLLWPPGRVYWRPIADRIGARATVLLVIILAAGFGGAAASFTTASLPSIVLGIATAYLIGMVAIHRILQPDSPSHLIFYR